MFKTTLTAWRCGSKIRLLRTTTTFGRRGTYLLALHAACAQVTHLSGAGECVDRILEDMEQIEGLAHDGTSSDVLHHVLAVQTSLMCGAAIELLYQLNEHEVGSPVDYLGTLPHQIDTPTCMTSHLEMVATLHSGGSEYALPLSSERFGASSIVPDPRLPQHALTAPTRAGKLTHNHNL